MSGPFWWPVGPAAEQEDGSTSSGRVTAIVVSPNYDRRKTPAMFLGTQGGVWRSDDFASADPLWVPLTDNMPLNLLSSERARLLSVTSLAIHAKRPWELYVGTDRGRLLKSEWGGETWELLAQERFSRRQAVSRIIIDPWADVLYVCAALPDDPIRCRVLKSVDGGQTWSAMEQGLPTGAWIADLDYTVSFQGYFLPRFTLYASVQNDGLYESTTGADGWKAMQQDYSSFTYALTADHQPSLEPAIYVAALHSVGDKNLTFDALLALDYDMRMWKTVKGVRPSNVDTNAYSGMALGVAPSGAIYVGMLGMHQSIDGGATWHDIGGAPQPHVDAHAWAFYGGVVYLGNDGGIWRYTPRSSDETQGVWDSLNSFELQTHLCNSIALFPGNRGIALAGCQDNGTVLRSHDMTWKMVEGGDGGLVRWEPDPNHQTAYRTNSPAGGAVLKRSDDGGKTWFDRSLELVKGSLVPGDGHTDYVQIAVHPLHPERLLMGYHAVYESLNRGDTWTPISGLLEGAAEVRALAYVGIDKIVGFSNGQLWRKYDGNPWNRVAPKDNSDWGGVITGIAVYVDQSAFLYKIYFTVSGDNGDTGRIWRSMDGGQTFSDITGNLGSIGINAVATFKDHWLFVGTNVGVFAAPEQDNAPCWVRFGAGMPDVSVTDLDISIGHNFLAAATYGRGVFLADLSGLGLPLAPQVKIQFAEASNPVVGQTAHFSVETQGLSDLIPLRYNWVIWANNKIVRKGFEPTFSTKIPASSQPVVVRVIVNMDGCEVTDSVSFLPRSS